MFGSLSCCNVLPCHICLNSPSCAWLFWPSTTKIELQFIYSQRQCGRLCIVWTTVCSIDTQCDACRRFTDQDLLLSDLKVSKGTLIYVSLFALHTSRLLWDKAETFAPERWISRDGQIPEIDKVISHGTDDKARLFLPFSNGPRSCIAQVILMHMTRSPWWHAYQALCDWLPLSFLHQLLNAPVLWKVLAMMELRIALAKLCCQFHFLPTSTNLLQVDAENSEVMSLTLQMAGGMHLHCIPRKRGTHWLS